MRLLAALVQIFIIGTGMEVRSQNLWNEVKKGVKKEIRKVETTQKRFGGDTSRGSGSSDSSTASVSTSGDAQILSSCGLTDISLRPVGKPENGGKEHVAVAAIPTKVTAQVGWRDKLPAPWKCDNETLTTLCDHITAYNKKRQQDPNTYQWNEVLAVADADYNDDELQRRIEALETAAEAYKECKVTFADGSSSEQDKRVAARALANALGSAYYKRALQSERTSLYARMKNTAAVETLRQTPMRNRL